MTFAIELDGQRALVTGAGQGVGREIAHLLARAGARVAVNDVAPERADAVVAEIHEQGGAADPVVFDVTDYGAVAAGMTEAGPVDILVNNAGNAGTVGWQFDPFASTEPETWDRYIAVNLIGVMNCTRLALPSMIERQHGRVVTIISEASVVGRTATTEPFRPPVLIVRTPFAPRAVLR